MIVEETLGLKFAFSGRQQEFATGESRNDFEKLIMEINLEAVPVSSWDFRSVLRLRKQN